MCSPVLLMQWHLFASATACSCPGSTCVWVEVPVLVFDVSTSVPGRSPLFSESTEREVTCKERRVWRGIVALLKGISCLQCTDKGIRKYPLK